MEYLDTATLQVALALVSTASAVVMFLMWRSADAVPGLGYWTISITLLGIGFLLLTFRGSAPELIASVLSVILITVALSQFYRGTKDFSHQRPHTVLEVLAIGTVSIGFLVLTYIYPHPGYRALLLAMVTFTLSSAIVATFWQHRRFPWRSAALGISGVFTILAIGMLVRIFVIVSGGIDAYSYRTNTSVPILNLLFLFIQLSLSLCLMFLCTAYLTHELRTHTLKLEQSNADLSDFAYIASHDLKEPLRTISNYSSLITERRSEHVDELTGKSLDFINDAAQRMQALIEAILDHSRIGQDMTIDTIDCDDLLTKIQQDLSSLIEDTHASISSQSLPILKANEAELRLLLTNLLTNAIKFRKPDQCPQIVVSASREGRNWVLSVEDNGIGIDVEHHDRIFTIFSRLHGRERYDGTGIGLAHCRKIVERHGGRIWVSSAAGEGSKFSFSLPGD
ncbi:MAG: ATP-binding protein [Pseudomonadota bacterium]